MFYDYFEKDHLGNIRVVLTDEKQEDVYPAVSVSGLEGLYESSLVLFGQTPPNKLVPKTKTYEMRM